MEMSEQFVLKFFESTFKNISDIPWYKTIYYYITDSKYRTMKQLNFFLSEQLSNQNAALMKIAQELRSDSNSPDELIIKVLEYVHNRTTYISDVNKFGYTENWVQAIDTWNSETGDCEDQNSLIYVLTRMAGISDLCLWSCIGDSSLGGHYWNIYFSPSKEMWYSIDATFSPDLTPIGKRLPWTLNNKYQDIWYLFNENITLKQ